MIETLKMSKVCLRLSRFSLSQNVFTSQSHVDLRPCATRMLSVTSQLHAKSRKPPDEGEDLDASKPIKFSTSKASHRTWKVNQSLGSSYQRPWWKVLPITLFGVGFLIWCLFRKETEIDMSLEKNLYEHLPELLSSDDDDDDEKKGDTNKPS